MHAPSLLLTQRVWGREPWEKLRRAKDLAEMVGARVVVLHPPFRWQREYVRGFEKGLAEMAAETDVIFAVENMYPLRGGRHRGRAVRAALGPDRARRPARHAGSVAHSRLRVGRPAHGGRARRPPGPRAPGRRHRLPGRSDPGRAPGARPRRPALRRAARPPARRRATRGAVVVEVKTNRAPSRAERLADLGEALAFARQHLNVATGHAARG